MSFFAGKTVLISDAVVSISLEALWSALEKALHEQSTVAPPRRRPNSVTSKILDFIIEHPGQYCTDELCKLNPTINGGTIHGATQRLRRQGKIDHDKNGKWFVVAQQQSNGMTVPNRILRQMRLDPKASWRRNELARAINAPTGSMGGPLGNLAREHLITNGPNRGTWVLTQKGI